MSSPESLPQSDRFEFIRRLSVNSLAEGWETTVRGIGRHCFVKIPARQSEISTAEQVKALTHSFRLQERFRFSGVLRAVGCHRHANTCCIEYPFIETDDYRPWTPRQWTAEHTAYLIEAALTIDLLHSLGIVHCDLKLENFALRRRGRGWYPTLIDLDFLWESGQRRPAWIAGTPGRIAPEVLAGSELSARTDLFSLGQSLRALTQSSDFTADPGEFSSLERLQMMLSEPSPECRPDSLLLAMNRADLIDAAKFRELQKRLLAARLTNAFRAERRRIAGGNLDPQETIFFACGVYSIPDDFAQDLAAAFVCRPLTAVAAFKEFWASAEVDQYGDFWQARVPDEVIFELYEKLGVCRPSPSETSSEPAEQREGRPAAGLHEYLTIRKRWRAGQYPASDAAARFAALKKLSDMAVRLRRPDEAAEYMRPLLGMLGPDDPEFEGTARRLVVQLFAAGRKDEGEAELGRAKASLGGTRPAAVRSLDRVGVWLLTTRGKLDEAYAELERIIGEARAPDEISTLVNALGNQATLCHKRGDTDRARALYAECLRLASAHDLISDIAYLVGEYAQFCYELGDFKGSLEILREFGGALTSSDQPYLRRLCYNSLAITHTRLGNYQKAEQSLGMLLNETHRQSGPLAYAGYYASLGWHNTVRCRIPQARISLDKSKALGKLAGVPHHEMQAHKNLAYLALMEGSSDLCQREARLCTDLATQIGDQASIMEGRALVTLNAILYGVPPAANDCVDTVNDLIRECCLSYAGLFYLQALAACNDDLGREVRQAVDPVMPCVSAGQGPIAEAVRLCLEADAHPEDGDAVLQKFKAALAILEAAEYKFTSALLCERLADLLHFHNHPKLANRFLAHAHALAAGLSNDVLMTRMAAKQDERSRLTYEKSALLETIDGISSIIENLDNYPNALESIVRFAVRATEAERGVLLTRESREAPLQVRAYVNFDPAALRDVQDFSRSVASTALNSGQPFMVGDALADDRTRKVKSIFVHNVRSIICVPIVSHEHVDAVIYLDHHTIPALFDDDDVRFIRALSRFLSIVLRTARDQKSADARLDYLEQRLKETGGSDTFLTADPDTLRMLTDLPIIAESRANVLLCGESGTGKEILSRRIHELSGRGDRPLIAVNCAAIPPTLVESELFGIVKGAASGVESREGKFEAADGGTLFLDEIGEMPLEVQAKLLRVIESRRFERVGSNQTIEVDVRFIFATNRNLSEMVESGKFRQDLMFRLAVVNLEIAPLRERVDDIALLVEYFGQIHPAAKKSPVFFSDHALTYLEAYSWPGNVRELANMVEALRIHYPGQTINVQQLPKQIVAEFRRSGGDSIRPAQAEKRRMERVLERCDWNIAKAARGFGIPLTTFRRKMKKHGIRLR